MMMKRVVLAIALLAFLTGCSTTTPDDLTVEEEPEDGEASAGEDESEGELGVVATMGTQYANIRLTRVATGLEHPWAVAFLPDGQMLVTERPGRLQLVNGDGGMEEISGVPEVKSQNQGGLLDIVIHPEFEENSWVYMTYSKPDESGEETSTTLIRGVLEGTSLNDVEEIFTQDRYSESGRHYGSRLAWTGDQKLLMSVGDRGSEPPRAQDLGDHAGTLLRLNDDGSIPDDNPFVDDDDAHDEIYSYGHRNIQGIVVHPDTEEIWVTEHGPRGGDELNLVVAGENYGWPTATLGLNYRNQQDFPDSEARRVEGMVDPFYEFLPTHAPSGLALVTTDRFENWDGDLLAGGLRSRRIRRVVFDDEEVLHEEELLLHEVGRIRDVREGPEGNIYVLTDSSSGSLYRIEPQ